MAARYLEDYVPGSSAEFGAARVSEDEILTFAERYDPQPFHTDPQAAAATPYGGLIASGWQTAAIAMRMLVDEYIDGTTSLGSPGLGPLRWMRPVRPGDVLRVRARVLENRPSQSKPDRGTVILEVDVVNQRDEVVLAIENWIAIVRRRPDAVA
ncbi:MAG TPA: MaoC family dehydratase [Candidatus Limnocylindria bacterium]|nr:MaoC family dehydratase [Candidatus Limnocylindria bacterium]